MRLSLNPDLRDGRDVDDVDGEGRRDRIRKTVVHLELGNRTNPGTARLQRLQADGLFSFEEEFDDILTFEDLIPNSRVGKHRAGRSLRGEDPIAKQRSIFLIDRKDVCLFFFVDKEIFHLDALNLGIVLDNNIGKGDGDGVSSVWRIEDLPLEGLVRRDRSDRDPGIALREDAKRVGNSIGEEVRPIAFRMVPDVLGKRNVDGQVAARPRRFLAIG